MTTALSHLVRLAPLLALPALALSCKPAPAEEFHYIFLFPRPDVPLGGVLLLGEKEIGKIHPAGRGSTGDDRRFAMTATILPRSAGPMSAAASSLRVRLTGACGESFAPIKVLDGAPLHAGKANDFKFSAAWEQEQRDAIDARKPEVRPSWPIRVPIDWAEQPPDTKAPVTLIYVDDHGASPPPVITIGTLVVERDDVFKTQSLGCAKSFSVKAGGVEIGTLDPAAPGSAFLISTTPSCYRERLITYSSGKDRGPMPSGSPTIHGPGTVIPLLHVPSYFLKPAPGTASGGGTAFSAAEVVAAPCPAP